MFGITVIGSWWFRAVLSGLNKKLEEGEEDWDAQPAQSTTAAGVEVLDSPDEALRMRKGFRYLV